MKKLLFSLVFLSTFTFAQAQILYGGLEDAYRSFMLQAHSQFNKGVLNDFMGVGGDTRFMNNQWLVGGATNNYEVTISGNYYFNYDFLAQELHAKWKDTTIIVNTNYIKRFFLLNANITHNFVKSPAIDAQGKYFFESLGFNDQTNDSGKVVQLLKLRTVKQLKAKKDDYLANFNGDFSDKMDNNIDYYIVLPDNSYTKVKLTKKSLSSALSKYKEKCDSFFKSISELNEQTAGELIRSINQ